jgi:hypothetical protein
MRPGDDRDFSGGLQGHPPREFDAFIEGKKGEFSVGASDDKPIQRGGKPFFEIPVKCVPAMFPSRSKGVGIGA